MFVSKIKTRYIKPRKSRLCQGDIFRNLSFSISGIGFGVKKDEIFLEYAVVMSQDCDINSDYICRKSHKNNNQSLPTILICPAYNCASFCMGQHIQGWKMDTSVSKEKLIKNEDFKRYHYLEEDIDNSVPELAIDFKHFFALPTDFLYDNRKDHYVATINELFREALSQRFAVFLSRFGLPEITENNKTKAVNGTKLL